MMAKNAAGYPRSGPQILEVEFLRVKVKIIERILLPVLAGETEENKAVSDLVQGLLKHVIRLCPLVINFFHFRVLKI